MRRATAWKSLWTPGIAGSIAAAALAASILVRPAVFARQSDLGLRNREALVFSSTRSGITSDLFRLDPDGTITRLTDHPADDTQPTVSPDGATIAFTRSAGQSATPSAGDLHLIDLDGSDERPILVAPTGSDFRPSWSPDGSRILFSRLAPDGMGSSIWIVGADGSAPRQLTSAAGHSNYASFASADRIVFNSNRDGTFKVWEMALEDEGSARPITSGPDTAPATSDDGQSVAFRSQRSGIGIWIADSAGTAPRQVTTGDDKFPAWSPDGTRVAFARRDPTCPSQAGTFCPHTLKIVDLASGGTTDVAGMATANDLFSAFAKIPGPSRDRTAQETTPSTEREQQEPEPAPRRDSSPAPEGPAQAQELPVTGTAATDAVTGAALLVCALFLRRVRRMLRVQP